MSISNYYFPYPDPVVHFAYKLPSIYVVPIKSTSSESKEEKKPHIEAWRNFKTTLPDLAKYLEQNFPKAIDELKRDIENKKYMLLYNSPIPGSVYDKEYKDRETKKRKMYNLIGALQYFLYTFPSLRGEVKQSSLHYLSKIHLGSPHLFYRWLWRRGMNDNINYQIVSTVPVYPIISNERFVPLDQDTLFIFDSEREKRNVGEEFKFNDIYCGDLQQGWEYAAKRGNLGTFAICLDLFYKQRNVDLLGYNV